MAIVRVMVRDIVFQCEGSRKGKNREIDSQAIPTFLH